MHHVMLLLMILIHQKEASYISTLELPPLNTMTIYSSVKKTLHMCFWGWNVRKCTCSISGAVSQVFSLFIDSLSISVFESHTKFYNSIATSSHFFLLSSQRSTSYPIFHIIHHTIFHLDVPKGQEHDITRQLENHIKIVRSATKHPYH